ncbi:protein NRT1/ PTR FAMILY 6.2 [Sesamum alatum]|uniref:Protein NRT1/ PTR FAMILY 6.2 n=1 Tax=Sesamum alatum TaxID=300844 RepID=A0AAE2CF60_9LAMI|nr:protein NRT1/ PTR FAMILY 6.2 [Sesamum alatum]
MSPLRLARMIAVLLLLSISCKQVSLVLADIGTATSYDPPYAPTKCNGNRADQFPAGNLFVQVSEVLWDNGAACGRRYRLRCLSGSNKPCKGGTVDVRVVDFCSRRPCPSTIVMSNDAFDAVSRSPDAKINIEFIQEDSVLLPSLDLQVNCDSMVLEEKTVRFAADAVDHRGSPADKSKTGGWLPATLILGVEFCERLSTMGIAVNLVTYLIGTMHLPSATSANIVTDFMGTCLLLSFLGGFLADSFLGRYTTVAIFASVQTLGTGMLAVSTRLPQFRPPPCHVQSTMQICAQASASQMAMLYASLYVIAVGTGGLKSSVSGFGTDQFDESDDKEKPEMNLFFGRFFFLVSLGTMMAVTVLVYVQDEVSRCLAYGICSISMFIAILIFLAGSHKYRYKTTSASPLIQILQVLVAAVRKRHHQVPNDANLLYEISTESSIHHSHQFKFLDKAAIITREDYAAENNIVSPNPWTLCSITQVEEVKMMMRLVPTWATTITFWATHAQMITFSVEQASTMDRYIGGFQIPAASLTVFLVATILISLAVYDLFIITWIGKPGFTNLQRIGIGLVLSALGMAAAALVEKRRLANAKEIAQSSATQPISVFLLIPQFLLVGCREAFIYTGQLDLFITQSPKGMKSMSTGLFLTALSLGFFMSSLLVSVVKRATGKGWVGDRIDNGRLDCFYGLLAVLSFINFWLFLLCAKWYRSKTTTRKDLAVDKGEDEC